VQLAERGFGVWSHDSYYAVGLQERFGWGHTLRVGLVHYNTLEEVDRLHEALAELVGSRRRAAGGSRRREVRPSSGEAVALTVPAP
jgi:hypothetical protein